MATIANIKENLNLIKRFKDLQSNKDVMSFFTEALDNQLIGFAKDFIGWGTLSTEEGDFILFNGYKVYGLSEEGLYTEEVKDLQILKLIASEFEKILE